MARKTAKTPDEAAALRNPRLRPQVVGNGGLYFAAYRLSKMGWNVMPTSRNARGVDILAYDMHTQNYPRHSGQGAFKTQQRFAWPIH